MALAALALLFGLGCTADNSYPTIGYTNQALRRATEHFDAGIKSLADGQKVLADTPETASLIDAISASQQDTARDFAMAIKAISDQTVAQANARVESILTPLSASLGTGGLAGLAGVVLSLRRRDKEQDETKSRQEKIEERVGAVASDIGATVTAVSNGLNELKHTLAANAPPPVVPVQVPSPTPVAPAAKPV